MRQNIHLFIQARSGSQRLKNKIFKKIDNYYLIDWVVKRCLLVKKINKVFVLTTNGKEDDKLERYLKKYKKINIFRGSRDNVMERFYSCGIKYNSNIIIRVCADNPFIDWGEINRLIRFFKNNAVDYACNHQNRKNSKYADGFGAEIFRLKSLRYCFLQKNLKKKYQEHVTLFFWKSKKFKKLSVKAPKCLAFPKLIFDINTTNDLKKIKKIVHDLKIDINTSAKNIVKKFIGYYGKKNQF